MTGVAQSSRLVGTVMGEQNVLWGRPERLTHAGTHAGLRSRTGSRGSHTTSSRDGSGAPHREPAAPARAARTMNAVTAGGLA
jgi:hypothetical protein